MRGGSKESPQRPYEAEEYHMVSWRSPWRPSHREWHSRWCNFWNEARYRLRAVLRALISPSYTKRKGGYQYRE